MRSQLMNNENW